MNKRQDEIKFAKAKYPQIEEEYIGGINILSDDTFDVIRLKNAIKKGLNEQERKIIILYAEFHSIDAVASVLNCGRTTIHRKLQVIREKIKAYANIL